MAKQKKTNQKSFDKKEEIQALIIELVHRYGNEIENYKWPWEETRWMELLYCCALQLRDPEVLPDDVFRAISHLADMNLLNIRVLAALNNDGKPDFSHPDLKLSQDVLIRCGMSPEFSKNLLITASELAVGIESMSQGKLQVFLRKYGKMMVEELYRMISFTKIDQENAKVALTHWLQNTTNLPLALSESNLEELGKALDTTGANLISLIDELDLNLTMIDDFLFSWVESEQEAAYDEELV